MFGIFLALLIVMAKHGPKVHKFAMNIFGTGAKRMMFESLIVPGFTEEADESYLFALWEDQRNGIEMGDR